MITRTFFVLTLIIMGLTVNAKEDAYIYSIKVKVPDTTWTLVIDSAYLYQDKLHIIAKLDRLGSDSNPIMGAMVISSVEANATLPLYDAEPMIYILGKTWGWPNSEPYEFIEDEQVIQDILKEGEALELNY